MDPIPVVMDKEATWLPIFVGYPNVDSWARGNCIGNSIRRKKVSVEIFGSHSQKMSQEFKMVCLSLKVLELDIVIISGHVLYSFRHWVKLKVVLRVLSIQK